MKRFFQFSEYFLEVAKLYKKAHYKYFLYLRVCTSQFADKKRYLSKYITPEEVFHIKFYYFILIRNIYTLFEISSNHREENINTHQNMQCITKLYCYQFMQRIIDSNMNRNEEEINHKDCSNYKIPNQFKFTRRLNCWNFFQKFS